MACPCIHSDLSIEVKGWLELRNLRWARAAEGSHYFRKKSLSIQKQNKTGVGRKEEDPTLHPRVTCCWQTPVSQSPLCVSSFVLRPVPCGPWLSTPSAIYMLSIYDNKFHSRHGSLNFFKMYLFIVVYLWFACMYDWVPCSCSACRGHKRAPDSLEVDLRTVISCHTGAGTESVSSPRAASDLKHWAISSNPKNFFILPDFNQL